jgi:hypothetical protein
MGYKQIRVGQLIAPFGPGSIYTDRRGTPHVVAGLDWWHMKLDQTSGKMISCSNPEEFERSEPRLSVLLRVDRFRLPPDYRHVRLGDTPPPNASLNVPALRFPRWYRHTRTGELHRFNLNTGKTPPADGGRWQPVRFISVCAAGHLCEFPWKQWIDCLCPDDGSLLLIDRGGSELSSIRIQCRTCPPGSTGNKGRHIGGTTTLRGGQATNQSAFQRKGIVCPGEKPWLGEGAIDVGCNQALVGALINQTNIYFPRTLSAISLPDLKPQDEDLSRLSRVLREDSSLGIARTLWNMGQHRQAAAMFAPTLADRAMAVSEGKLIGALRSLFEATSVNLPAGAATPSEAESPLLAFRRTEFNTLRVEINDSRANPDLIVIPTKIAPDLAPWFGRAMLVERLRETRVFYGFDRLKTDAPLQGMPEVAMNQLFRVPPHDPQDRWLPAVEIFGEGIYLELREDRLSTWIQENWVWLESRLDDRFIVRLSELAQTLPPSGPVTRLWAARYLCVHTLAHILINQLVFECGYSTASLRERLYVSADPAAPMAGFLVYTAAGDADGTLGGLVRLGRAERLDGVVRRALDRASWCSADPVCSEHLGGQGSRQVNLAACHACILLPETTCETINHGLDRALIVGTPTERSRGFMSILLEGVFELA